MNTTLLFLFSVLLLFCAMGVHSQGFRRRSFFGQRGLGDRGFGGRPFGGEEAAEGAFGRPQRPGFFRGNRGGMSTSPRAPGGFPGGFPGGTPGGFSGGSSGGPTGGFPGGFPGGPSGGFPGGFPGGLSGGFPGGFPGDFLGGFSGGFPGVPGGFFDRLPGGRPPRPGSFGFGNMWRTFLANEAERVSWNRTLQSVEVEESAYMLNSSMTSSVLVVSRDPQLKEVNFTGAATLYTFDDTQATVAVRPGFRQLGGLCLLLPAEAGTFQQTQDTLNARNGTTIAAPTTVVRLNGTGAPLNMMEMIQLYMKQPSLALFCGFSGLVRATPADGATFPADSGTETEDVLRLITMDTELNVLVPKRTPSRRFRGPRPSSGGLDG